MAFERKRICGITSAILVLFIISSVILAYSYYLDLKKALLTKLSGRAAALIGQGIDIGDIAFSTTAGINLYDIVISNPEGFEAGKLLKIRKVSMNMKFKELLNGRFYFRDIEVNSPELSIIKDKDGRLNVSDKFMKFLSEKSRIKYQIDEFRIVSGSLGLYRNELLRGENIKVSLKNLSSNPGTKTMINVSASFAGGNSMNISGWAYLKDEPKKFSLSVSSEGLNLSAFREISGRYNIDIRKTLLNIRITAEGDTGKGVDLKSKMQIKTPELALFRKDPLNINVNADAFYDIHDDSVLINDISLNAGDVSALKLRGVIREVRKDPSYSAGLKIERLDLSAFNFIRDLKIGGVISSDDISIAGKFNKALPEITGSLWLKDASVRSADADAEEINAELKLSGGRKMSVKAVASAKVLKAGDILKKPAGIKLLMNTQVTPENIIAEDLLIETEGLKISSGRSTLIMPGEKGPLVFDATDVNVSYPEKKTSVKQMECNLKLNAGEKAVSGEFIFSIEKIIFEDVSSGVISGSGRFDGKEFHVAIPRLEVPRGNIRLTAGGRISGGPFPVDIQADAENIDMGVISRVASGFNKFPYNLSGDIKKAAFKGTIGSADSMHGIAILQAEKISVSGSDSSKIIKNGTLYADIKFNGRDLEFRTDMKAGDISAAGSGTVKEFLENNRIVKVEVTLPEVKITSIRDSLWDVFPDKLLYAGLDGSISTRVSVDYRDSGLMTTGDLMLKDIIIEGENGEYSAGPINGEVPFIYDKRFKGQDVIDIPLFERKEFENVSRHYSGDYQDRDFSLITIGSLNYGFKLLDNINIWFKQKGTVLNIGRVSANIFGGRLNGSAVVDISDSINYRAGFVLEGLSLTSMCDGIEPIKGYISGKVNGIATLKGAGAGITGLMGKADFWSYSTKSEETKISREFLEKVGGTAVKSYLGDRKFDKGVMNMYIQDGFLIFRELEISNRNFLGVTDLSVKVAPFNNRIAIDHLMWTITEAAQRAKER